MIQRNYRVFSILLVTALILACTPILAPTSTPPPAFDPNSANTAIVLTADSAATQTALLAGPSVTPTFTPLPTNTALPSETPSPTFIFVLFTPTRPTSTPTLKFSSTQTGGTAGANTKYACALISQSPADYSTIASRSDFDGKWEVKNIGTEVWDITSSDYRWVGGNSFQKQDVYDFDKSVNPGGSMNLIVDMVAPRLPAPIPQPGKYSLEKQVFAS